MSYTARLIQVEQHGDREVIVRCPEGLPSPEINLYLMTYRECSYSYRLTMAYSIMRVYEWAKKQDIDLVERIQSGEFLSFLEMQSLQSSLRFRSRAPTDTPQTLEIGKKTFIGESTYATRCRHVLAFLNYLGDVFAGSRKLTDPYRKNKRDFIARLSQLFKAHRALTIPNQRYGLTEEQVHKLRWCVDPDNPDNPFQKRVRFRNQLIIDLLLLTGIRDGELLCLRPDALIRRPHGYVLRVTQNTTLDLDTRTNPPNVKTYEREIPVTDRLAGMVDNYIVTERKQRGKAAAKAPPYLFLNTKINPQPITISALVNLCNRVRKMEPKALKNLFPHILRHTFNDLLVLTTKLDPSGEEFKNIQRQLCGWSSTSTQGLEYMKRSREIIASRHLQEIEKQFTLKKSH